MDLVKGTHYQVACQKFFEMTHNVSKILNFITLSFVFCYSVFHLGVFAAAVETTPAVFREKRFIIQNEVAYKVYSRSRELSLDAAEPAIV